ncbi:uncharacterized protein LOC113281110 isoform X2 [Papaver somniferum]|uniref:uncharacterized protein LOC113281110 isoform X2 n=1 Tax=Papaver somniferum TaxID=3469 RepID=UPI000E6FE571|nr:uncharacterized protein LOC113281110 isoform X2 [Papaver somniferum]
MSERKAEPCSPEIGNTEVISRENSSDVEALLGWTSFEEVENIIGPCISQAIGKAVYGGYKSAQEVYDDYKIFTHALIRLVEGQDKLPFECYADDEALQEKNKMLHWFSDMLSDASLGKIDRDWISGQLAEDKISEDFCLDDLQFNTYWAKKLKMVDDDVKSDLMRQKQEKLCGFIYHKENEFQADDLSERKKEFEELKRQISCTHDKLESLVERAATYYETLEEVKDPKSASMLGMAFQTLLRVDENLSSMWSEETVRGMDVVLKEKKKSVKARDICAANWNKTVASSGLVG